MNMNIKLELLKCSESNKSSAFTQGERASFKLNGLLPDHEETLEAQVKRAYRQLHGKKTNFDKFIFLKGIAGVDPSVDIERAINAQNWIPSYVLYHLKMDL